MFDVVYAIWFTDYDDQHIEGPLYKDKVEAENRCVELNKNYTSLYPWRYDRYYVEEHEVV